MKYSIKVNEVRAKRAAISRICHSGIRDSFKITKLQSLRIRTRESFSYQCLDTAPMSVMKAMA